MKRTPFSLLLLGSVAVVVGVLLIPCVAFAQLVAKDSLLLGGGIARHFKATEVDPALPVGARMVSAARPTSKARFCSLSRPVCVHTDMTRDARATSDWTSEQALEVMEQAYAALVYALGAPSPANDGELGGGPQLDLYLVTAQDAPSELVVQQDAPQLLLDSSSAFCVTGSEVTAQDATRCVTGALTYRLDAAESPHARVALAEYATWTVFGGDDAAIQAVDDAQANPQISMLSREVHESSKAGALWWSFLDSRYGAGRPLDLPLAVFQLSARPSDAERRVRPRWFNEPDTLDVVRAIFGEERRVEAEAVLDFATSRAFLGDRSDAAHGQHLPWLGPWGRMRFDWVVPYSSLPRNLSTVRAIEPFGSVGVWLDMDKVPAAARLGVRVTWESPVRFHWRAVGLDDRGREVTRWDFPYLESKTQIEKTLINLDHVSAVVFIGVNLGGVDLAVPFDPDFEPWEPHRATLYLANLE